MTSALPTLDSLRSNPDWAKLPLFDRKGWTKVRFGDVVENVNETEREPLKAGIERFIGLEHLEPGSLHVRTWGSMADGTTFTRRCRPGQVLFGKRRAYQRKVAVAEFDAVVSSDIYVFAPKGDRLLPELLPFLCLSERFFKFAVETSAGSLSPRTNWSHLAQFQFDLPSVDQQRRLAEILWVVDETIQKYLDTIKSSDAWRASFVAESWADRRSPQVQLGRAIRAITPGRSVVGVNEPAGREEYGVLKVSAVGPKGFVAEEHKRILDRKDFILRFAVRSGDFLITRCNTTELVGRVCIVPRDYPSLMLSDKTIKLEFDGALADVKYIESILRSPAARRQIEAQATGTGGAMKNISQDEIKSLIVPLPDIGRQRELVETLEKGAAFLSSLEGSVKSAVAVQTSFANSIFN
jgi:type I restriction enzyme S subunit